MRARFDLDIATERPAAKFFLGLTAVLICVVLAALPVAFGYLPTPARFFVPSNETTTSLGLMMLGGSTAKTQESTIVIQVSNCTTSQGSTSCVPIAGATLNLTVRRPDNAINFIGNFDDLGNGDYRMYYDFKEAGNYTLNFSASRDAVGNNSLVRVFPISGFAYFNDSEAHKFENRTFFGGYNLSFMNFNATVSKFVNFSITSRETNITFNLSIFCNASIPREVLMMPDDSIVSPRTADIIQKYIDKAGKRNIITINETNATLAALQEVTFVLNGTVVSLNVTVYNVTRDFAYLSDRGFIVTPGQAAVSNITFNDTRNALNFRANGTGNQEVVVYIGNNSEPANITIDGSVTLTSANWTFNATARTIIFNYTFSERSFEVNFPAQQQGQQQQQDQQQSQPAPSGGGGGGGGVITAAAPKPKPGNFTVEPALLRASLLQGETKALALTILNTADRNDTYEVTTDAREFAAIPENVFALAPQEAKRIDIQVFALETLVPDIYVRKIFVKGTDATKTASLVIDVSPRRPLFDIKLDVLPEYKLVPPNATALFRVSFTNLGTLRTADINVTFTLTHIEGNLTLPSVSEIIHVETQLSTVKFVRIPHYAPEGKYALTMRAAVGSQLIVASDIVEVREGAAIVQPFFDITPVLIAVMLGIAIAAAVIVVYIHLEHRKIEREIAQSRQRRAYKRTKSNSDKVEG